jgi:hypothetical protein
VWVLVQAEERGCVALSHGDKEEDKRVFVFPKDKGPNHLETRFLQLGGTGPAPTTPPPTPRPATPPPALRPSPFGSRLSSASLCLSISSSLCVRACERASELMHRREGGRGGRGMDCSLYPAYSS